MFLFIIIENVTFSLHLLKSHVFYSVIYITETGRCKVYNQLKKENVIVELETLIKKAENFDEELSSYAEFMKQRILSVSGNN